MCLGVCVSVCGGSLLPGVWCGGGRLMVMQPCDGAQTAEACATSLDEMEGKTRSSKDGHSLKLLEGTV